MIGTIYCTFPDSVNLLLELISHFDNAIVGLLHAVVKCFQTLYVLIQGIIVSLELVPAAAQCTVAPLQLLLL